MASLTDEVLRMIAMNRKFQRNYAVVRNLMNNPKTPSPTSPSILLPSVTSAPDLKKLAANKNVS